MSDFDSDGVPEEEEPTAPFWMATYGDMVTLLLTFFVMLVAMSEVEVEKFEEAMSYFTGGRGMMTAEGIMPGIMGVVGSEETAQQAQRFEDLQEFVQTEGLEGAVDVDLTERGIRVTFVDSIAFASGSAELDGPAKTVLARISEAAASTAAFEVEGHTDDQPISTALYPSNWELSAARAAAVVRFLLEQPDPLPPQHYLAVGYGEHRPRTSNDTPEGRSRNRRIAVLIRAADAEMPPARGPHSVPGPPDLSSPSVTPSPAAPDDVDPR